MIILAGANDACASTEAETTPVATFRAQFAAARSTLSGGLPSARIYVVSIPDVYRLWEIYHGSLAARTIDVAVSGIEYRMGTGAWTRYTAPVTVPAGTTLTWRAVDVNGSREATQALVV